MSEADFVAAQLASGAAPRRRDFIFIMTGAVAAGGAAALAWPLIDQMNPSADTLAFSSIEYAYAKVAVGQQVSVLWRKQPVFIRHRTPARSQPLSPTTTPRCAIRRPTPAGTRRGWPSG